MNNIEILKQELLSQKEKIERLGGTVKVANIHPSPSEITTGISTIPATDFSITTATEEDVAMGKTFFSKDANLKMGKSLIDPNAIHSIFMPEYKTQVSQEEYRYDMKNSTKITRKYSFYQNSNNITFRFGDDVTNIDDYSFYETPNFKFENFNELTKLERIGLYCFARSSGEGINISNLPNSLVNIDTGCFMGIVPKDINFRFPDNMKSLGQSLYRQDQYKLANNLDLSNFTFNQLPNYTFYRMGFSCDLIVPESVVTIGSYFNYNASFQRVVIHSGVNTIYNSCFGADAYSPLSNHFMRSFVFEGEIPPQTISSDIIARQAFTNGCKIFVPDNSIEAYKNVPNLKKYSEYIYPMSQRDY